MDRKEKLTTLIEEFIKKWSEEELHAPQGSAAWKEKRITGIGASEVATLLKVGYQTEAGLVASKLGLEQFNGSPATWWGNLMEEINRLLCEEKFKCKIYETTSIPDEEWAQVENAAVAFWDEIAAEGEVQAKVVEIFRKYNADMQKAGRPYRYG